MMLPSIISGRVSRVPLPVSGASRNARKSPPVPYVQNSMCVSALGWMLALIATSFQGAFVSSGSVTARIDSLLVRTSSPSRGLSRGSEPVSRGEL